MDLSSYRLCPSPPRLSSLTITQRFTFQRNSCESLRTVPFLPRRIPSEEARTPMSSCLQSSIWFSPQLLEEDKSWCVAANEKVGEQGWGGCRSSVSRFQYSVIPQQLYATWRGGPEVFLCLCYPDALWKKVSFNTHVVIKRLELFNPYPSPLCGLLKGFVTYLKIFMTFLYPIPCIFI